MKMIRSRVHYNQWDGALIIEEDKVMVNQVKEGVTMLRGREHVKKDLENVSLQSTEFSLFSKSYRAH